MGKILQVQVPLVGLVCHHYALVLILFGLDAPACTLWINKASTRGFLDFDGEGVVHRLRVWNGLLLFLISIVEVLIVYVVRERHVLSFLFALFLNHLGEETEVLEEVVLVLVLRVDFEDADYPVVPLLHKMVKLGSILHCNHTVCHILSQNLVGVAADLLKTLCSLVNFLVGFFFDLLMVFF